VYPELQWMQAGSVFPVLDPKVASPEGQAVRACAVLRAEAAVGDQKRPAALPAEVPDGVLVVSEAKDAPGRRSFD
jgi:hypothetical protein